MELKMYYFKPNDYDAEYFTISPDEETALENVKKYLFDKTWKDVTINTLPKRYTIEERENGGVFETEIS